MPSDLVHAADAAVVAHYAMLLAGRLEQRHLVDRTRALCDEARRAVRLLLADGATAAHRVEVVPQPRRPFA
jgi:hypothetical protein